MPFEASAATLLVLEIKSDLRDLLVHAEANSLLESNKLAKSPRIYWLPEAVERCVEGYSDIADQLPSH